MNRKIKKNHLIFLSIIALCLTGCNKLGINQSLPGIDRIIVEDNQNTNNKVGSIVVKNTSGTVIPNYFLWFKQNPSISTPSNVTDTMFVCVAPNTDISNLRIILTMADKAMSATVKDTNKIRVFQPLETPYSETVSGRLRNYTAVDTSGFYVTFSNGYQRHYIILLEVLDYVPPRIYDLGSYSGGLDSVDYNDAEQIITIYRSPFNTSIVQTLGYRYEPSDATIDPRYVPGSAFDFGLPKSIRVPIFVPKQDGTQKEEHYTINLNVGFYKVNEVLKKAGSTRDNENFPISGTIYDEEMAITVSENYVYVLRLISFPPNSNTGNSYKNYRNGQIFAYSLKDPTSSPIALQMPPAQGVLGDSFPPICDIMVSGNKLVGMGFTQRPGGSRTGNISKSFFISWDANNPQNYIIGDSLELTLFNTIGGSVPPIMVKGNIEGEIDKGEGAYYYTFHTNAFYLTDPDANNGRNPFPACKRIKLKVDASGAIRVASKGSGLDTSSYYFKADNLGTTSGLSGKIWFQHFPESEGGGSFLSTGGVTFYAKSILKGQVSSDPITASNAIYFCNTGKINSVIGGTGTLDNELNGMVYFNYGNKNYLASLDWQRGLNTKSVGISFFDIGSPVFSDMPAFPPINSTYIQSKRVYKQSMLSSSGSLAQNRGGIAQYKLANGSVRFAILVPGVGFGVYDIK